jgi:hypothetical protein
MPAQVLASAGVMELFAHGQDIADTLGVRREHTDRIRHVVRFAMGNWDFGYRVRGLTPPAGGFRFELTAPSGERWEFGPFGPADPAGTVTGLAVDFCLLVTRRRHRDDLAVTASGPEADHWLDIAQAYRGSPGQGRAPGQFAQAGSPAARLPDRLGPPEAGPDPWIPAFRGSGGADGLMWMPRSCTWRCMIAASTP